MIRATDVAHAHRPPRHARHSRQLRRLRNFRRRAFHAPGGARPQVTVYCRERFPQNRIPRRPPPIPAHHPPQVLRHAGAHLRLHAAPAGAPRGCGALLQRRQRHLHPLAAPVRHAGGAERGRHRAQAQEVEPAGQGLVPGFRMAGHVLPDGGGHRRARPSRTTTASATARRAPSFPTAPRSARWPARRCWRSWDWSPAAIFST